MQYNYGKQNDINRLKTLVGGIHSCKLDKMPDGVLTTMDNVRICDIDHPLASTVTSHYYKGVNAHKDNLVLWKK